MAKRKTTKKSIVDELFPGYVDMGSKPNPKSNKKAKENAIKLGTKNIKWE